MPESPKDTAPKITTLERYAIVEYTSCGTTCMELERTPEGDYLQRDDVIVAVRAQLNKLIEDAFIAGCKSMGDDVSYEYAYNRWLSSYIKADLDNLEL